MSVLEQGQVKAVGHSARCTLQILPKPWATEVVNCVPIDVEQLFCRVSSVGQHVNTMCVLWRCTAQLLHSKDRQNDWKLIFGLSANHRSPFVRCLLGA